MKTDTKYPATNCFQNLRKMVGLIECAKKLIKTTEVKENSITDKYKAQTHKIERERERQTEKNDKIYLSTFRFSPPPSHIYFPFGHLMFMYKLIAVIFVNEYSSLLSLAQITCVF